jgi:hypothetical protein
MSDYASSLSLVKMRGAARITQKAKYITSQIVDKIIELDFANVLDPSLIQSIACCIEASHGKRNRRARNPIDKMAVLFSVLAAVKKCDLSEHEKVAIRTTAEFCLQNGLVKSVPFLQLVLVNGFRLLVAYSTHSTYCSLVLPYTIFPGSLDTSSQVP